MPKIKAASLAEHRAQTFDELLDATRELIEERGYDAVSLRDIAQRAGLARTAIYNYTSDKADLLLALVERSTAPLRAEIDVIARRTEEPSIARLSAILELFLRAFDSGARDLALLRALHFSSTGTQGEAATEELRRGITGRIAQVIQEGVDTGELRPVNVDLVVEFLEAIVEAAIERAFADPTHVSGIVAETSAFVEHALSAEAPAGAPELPR